MTRQIAIGFVTYNPGSDFLRRAQIAAEAGFDVFIFDNSPQNVSSRKIAARFPRIKCFTSGKNLGLGMGISFVCAEAYFEGHKALLFFDQDTVFSERTLSFIERAYIGNVAKSNNYSAWVFNSKGLPSQAEHPLLVTDVMLGINSGSLYFLENCQRLGWHDESYFVDCVDYSFCLRSMRSKLKVGQITNTPDFDHVAEQGDSEYTILGKKYLLRPYSLKRIGDTIRASLRLIFDSLVHGEFAFSARIGWLFSTYLGAQVLVRVFPK